MYYMVDFRVENVYNSENCVIHIEVKVNYAKILVEPLKMKKLKLVIYVKV